MTEELLQTFHARLSKSGVTVSDVNAVAELERRGYGERRGEALALQDYEALYLLYEGKLQVSKGRRMIGFDELVEYALKRDADAWTRFLVYRDLRSRGYVAKEGFGFGVDFRVYGRGEYGSKSARFVVFSLNEGTEMNVEDLKMSVDKIARMGKETITAVVERRGEVIYYKVSRRRFSRLC